MSNKPANPKEPSPSASGEALRALALEMRQFIREHYPDSSLLAGNWPGVRALVDRWDAALAPSGEARPEQNKETA
jgi:hypothetical protein